MNARVRHQRQERKAARRRYRLSKLGPARRHWERRRNGTRNSAPQLRRRPTAPKHWPVGLLEDLLIQGRLR